MAEQGIPSEIEHIIEHGDRNGTVQIAPDAYPPAMLNAIRSRLAAEGFSVAVARIDSAPLTSESFRAEFPDPDRRTDG